MLTRTLGVLGIRTSPTAAVAWTDAASISDFAAEAVNAMYAFGIMGGVSDTAPVFAPKAPYTHEQSILTFNRLYDAVNR